MAFPKGEKITHDRDHILPALNVLLALLGIEFENVFAQTADIALIAQVITGESRGLVEQFLHAGLFAADAFQIAVPDAQPGDDFRRQHIELGAKDAGFGMQQVIKRSAGRGYGICFVFQRGVAVRHFHERETTARLKRLVPKAFGGIGSERIERKVYKPGSGDKTDVTHKGRHGMVATRQSARVDNSHAFGYFSNDFQMMNTLPTLLTERLILRPFTIDDAPQVQQMAGNREVASTTMRIPHPYKDGMAEDWIRSHAQDYAKGEGISLAITLRLTKTLAGAVGLTISREHDRAELGYWVGKEFWGKGFATEAAKALLTFGFQSLGLNRINARHLTRNPASGRVLVKIGMRHEGTLRQHVKKWGVFEDAKIYGILSSEFKIEAKLPSKMDAH